MLLNKNKHSFTLIEVLLAAVISAIIMAAVYNVFWTGTKLDAKLRYGHKNYSEMLKADFILSRDLENAVLLDLSSSYPNAETFHGRSNIMEFFIKTDLGIKRVRYTAGTINQGTRKVTVIGAHTKKISAVSNTKEILPIELLMRQELNLMDWVNEKMDRAPVEILLSSVRKDSFNCQYAPKSNDMDAENSSHLAYSQEWSQGGLPMVASCQFSLYDPKHPNAETIFKRDIFLSPQRGI